MKENKTIPDAEKEHSYYADAMAIALLGAGCVGIGVAITAYLTPTAGTTLAFGGAAWAAHHFYTKSKKNIFGKADVSKELDLLFEAAKDLEALALNKDKLNWAVCKYWYQYPNTYIQDAWYLYERSILIERHCNEEKQANIQRALRVIQKAIKAGPAREQFQDILDASGELNFLAFLQSIEKVSPDVLPSSLDLYVFDLDKVKDALNPDRKVLEKIQPYILAFSEGFESQMHELSDIMVTTWINILILEKSGWTRKLDEGMPELVINNAISSVRKGIGNKKEQTETEGVYPFLEMSKVYYLIQSIIDPHYKVTLPVSAFQIKNETKQKIQCLIQEIEYILSKNISNFASYQDRHLAYLPDALSPLMAPDMKEKLVQFFCNEKDEATLLLVKEKLCGIIMLALIEKETHVKQHTSKSLVCLQNKGIENGKNMVKLVKEAMNAFAKNRYRVKDVSAGFIKPTSRFAQVADYFTSWIRKESRKTTLNPIASSNEGKRIVGKKLSAK